MSDQPRHPDHDEQREQSEGQVSEGPNSLRSTETGQGGADAVPDKTTGASSTPKGEERGPE